MKRGDVGFRVDLIAVRGRPIRRHHRTGGGCRLSILRPTLVVVADERRVEAQRSEFPYAALLHVRVLVDAFRPGTLPLVSAGHIQLAAARTGGEAVRSHVDDRLQLEVIIQAAELEPFRPGESQELAHVTLADIHAGQTRLDRRVARKQVGRLIPAPPIDVVTVNALQILDLLLVFQPQRAMRQFGQTLRGAHAGHVRRAVVDTRPDVG